MSDDERKVRVEVDGVVYRGRHSVHQYGNRVYIDRKLVGVWSASSATMTAIRWSRRCRLRSSSAERGGPGCCGGDDRERWCPDEEWLRCRGGDDEMSDGLTHDECRQAADNFGIDLTCGECASVFYTGHSSAPHEAECKTLPFLRQLADQGRSGRSWRNQAEHDAGSDGIEASPSWHKGVPLCVESCSHHDGKRCRILGARPGRVCEPIVVQMSRLLG